MVGEGEKAGGKVDEDVACDHEACWRTVEARGFESPLQGILVEGDRDRGELTGEEEEEEGTGCRVEEEEGASRGEVERELREKFRRLGGATAKGLGCTRESRIGRLGKRGKALCSEVNRGGGWGRSGRRRGGWRVAEYAGALSGTAKNNGVEASRSQSDGHETVDQTKMRWTMAFCILDELEEVAHCLGPKKTCEGGRASV